VAERSPATPTTVAGQVVRRRIVGAAVRGDGNVGVRLGDGDRRSAALVQIVGAALEVPAARAARGVGEAGPEGEAAAGGRRSPATPTDRAVRFVRRRIVGAAVRGDGNVGVRLGDGDPPAVPLSVQILVPSKFQLPVPPGAW